MTRYRALEMLGFTLVVVGCLLSGLGGASILLNLSAVPWGRALTLLAIGIALYCAGHVIGKIGERHLQQPVDDHVRSLGA